MAGPDLPTGDITLPAPPRLPEVPGTGDLLTSVVPMLGGLGSVAVMATMTGAAKADQQRVLLAAGMFVVVTLGLVVAQVERQRARRLRTVGAARAAYLRHLGTVRAVIRDTAAQQRAAVLWRFPEPAALPSVAAERSRVWERSVADPDFLHVRYGVCSRPLSCSLVAPEDPSAQADPVSASALRRLVAVHGSQPDLPATLDLRSSRRIEVRGPQEEARALARSLICSAATFHSPDHLVVAVLASEESLGRWDWVKWLPHALSTRAADAVGPRRMVSTDLAELTQLLPPDRTDEPSATAEPSALPCTLVVVDGGVLPPGALTRGTVLHLGGPDDEVQDRTAVRLWFEDDTRVTERRHRRTGVPTVADLCGPATAEAVARRLAPLARVGSGPTDVQDRIPAADLPELLGVGDVRRLDPALSWRPRPARDRLRVPFGLGDGGAPVLLDLKEAARSGMGPHGLVVGATGSGKSELLRTLALGLTLTHAPEDLSLVLVDFKGGATFAGMSSLPHVSASITNLADDLTLVDRMQDALSGELVRRQEVLRDAGGFASADDYARARASGAALAPLPSLLIVVDEFSELLSARPEFTDLFVAIGRLGRSLGLHLLLASQRLEEGRLRGLESHLSYRICLRTFSAQESRAVLGVPDAYELPSTPGVGYLRTDQSTLVRFLAAHTSGPPTGRPRHARPDRCAAQPILPWTVARVPLPAQAATSPPRRAGLGRQESLLEVAVGRMVGHHRPRARRIWLPPLDTPDTLDVLLPDLAPDPRLGLVSHAWRTAGRLVVPLGTVDRPRQQRREALTVDLTGAGGHVAVVGGPRSGKSTLLRTLVATLALTTTPAETQVFVLDFGGGTCGALRGLPHVAGAAVRSEPDVVRRIVAEVTGIVDRREAWSGTAGIDAVDAYRGRRAHAWADDGYGDVFLVVDGWNALRAGFDDLEHELQLLAARGLTFGFHLVTATSRWGDYRAGVHDLFGTRLELRLGDPLDSEVDRRLAARVPAGRPGRGLRPDGLHFLAALPRIDGDPDVGSLGDGVERMVARVRDAWTGEAGPKLRLLPDRLEVHALLERAGDEPASGAHLLLGLDERGLAPVSLDPAAEPHWLVFGDGRSGKTAALRHYVREVMRTRTPEQAQIVVVDYRRTLLGEVPDGYLLHHLSGGRQAEPALAELADHLARRLPGPDVTPDRLRNRSWWTGPDVFVVVDDYDLVSTPQSSPVQALLPLLPQADDVGLHLVLARRAGGASRALYEPVIQALRDLAVPSLVLSGSPEEGPLVGTVRPTPLPPGRGRLVTRERGVQVVQLAWPEPSP